MADKFDTMTGPQLAAEAARLMGLDKRVIGYTLFWVKRGKDVEFDFDPANDLRHASEFGGAFLAAWPDASMCMPCFGRRNVCVVTCGEIFSYSEHASEATARTLAVCRAWTALKGEA